MQNPPGKGVSAWDLEKGRGVDKKDRRRKGRLGFRLACISSIFWILKSAFWGKGNHKRIVVEKGLATEGSTRVQRAVWGGGLAFGCS